MRLKNCSGRHNENPAPKGQKKDFHEGISDIRKAQQEAEMERRKKVREAEAKKAEDEVARMTFGPTYQPGE